MFRKLGLLLCLAFIVVSYTFPCLILPVVGSYKYEAEGVSTSIYFKLGNKAEVTTKNGELESKIEYKYSLDFAKNQVVLKNGENQEVARCDIESLHDISILGFNARNNIAYYLTIGVEVLTAILILLPNKKKK